jgi:hypothetical protein
MLRDHVLNEGSTQLIVLGSAFKVSMFGQSLNTLIIGIQNSRLCLEKTKLIRELDRFCARCVVPSRIRSPALHFC